MRAVLSRTMSAAAGVGPEVLEVAISDKANDCGQSQQQDNSQRTHKKHLAIE